MKQVLGAGAALLLLFVGRGYADDTTESLMKEFITALTDAGNLLGDIKDEATAKAAKPKLKKAGDQMRAIQQKFEKVARPDAAKEAELKKKYQPELKEALRKFIKEAVRLGETAWGKEAIKEMGELK